MTVTLERTQYKPPDTPAVTPQDVKDWELGLRNDFTPNELMEMINLQRQIAQARQLVVAGTVELVV